MNKLKFTLEDLEIIASSAFDDCESTTRIQEYYNIYNSIENCIDLDYGEFDYPKILSLFEKMYTVVLPVFANHPDEKSKYDKLCSKFKRLLVNACVKSVSLDGEEHTKLAVASKLYIEDTSSHFKNSTDTAAVLQFAREVEKSVLRRKRSHEQNALTNILNIFQKYELAKYLSKNDGCIVDEAWSLTAPTPEYSEWMKKADELIEEFGFECYIDDEEFEYIDTKRELMAHLELTDSAVLLLKRIRKEMKLPKDIEEEIDAIYDAYNNS